MFEGEAAEELLVVKSWRVDCMLEVLVHVNNLCSLRKALKLRNGCRVRVVPLNANDVT